MEEKSVYTCPKCKSINTQVTHNDKGNDTEIRIYRCNDCEFVFKTEEIPLHGAITNFPSEN